MALTEARRHNVADMKFYAFDSFEGLPDLVTDTSVEIWRRGALTTSEDEFRRLVREHGIYVDRVHTVKGFYGDSLTRALRGRFLEHENKIALVTIDCDLFESAVPVFEFIDPLLQDGAVLYIDDLFARYHGPAAQGVARAVLQVQRKRPMGFV